jgi:hypothetical protein
LWYESGEKMNAYGILVWKGRGKRGLGIPRRRLGYIIKVNRKEIGTCGLD